MLQIAEQFELYKTSNKIEAISNGTNIEPINAGTLLKTMLQELKDADEDEIEGTELSKINTESVIELSDILETVKKNIIII